MHLQSRAYPRPAGGEPADPYTRAVMLPVPVVRLDRDLPLPSYAHPGDAGLDLRAREDGVVPPGGGRLLMPTGIAIAIPVGYAGFVLPRSGNALHHGVTMANAPGLIDAAYRGEIASPPARRSVRMIARPIGNIIATVAVFEIHIEMKQQTAPYAKRILPGLSPTQRKERTR